MYKSTRTRFPWQAAPANRQVRVDYGLPLVAVTATTHHPSSSRQDRGKRDDYRRSGGQREKILGREKEQRRTC